MIPSNANDDIRRNARLCTRACNLQRNPLHHLGHVAVEHVEIPLKQKVRHRLRMEIWCPVHSDLEKFRDLEGVASVFDEPDVVPAKGVTWHVERSKSKQLSEPSKLT